MYGLTRALRERVVDGEGLNMWGGSEIYSGSTNNKQTITQNNKIIVYQIYSRNEINPVRA